MGLRSMIGKWIGRNDPKVEFREQIETSRDLVMRAKVQNKRANEELERTEAIQRTGNIFGDLFDFSEIQRPPPGNRDRFGRAPNS